MTSNFDCVVIGAGVAGMTSAIYLKRAGLNIILLEKSAPGGQINMSPCVENYPGCINIDGATLSMNIFSQVNSLNIEYKYGNVLSVKKENDIFKIRTDLEEICSKSVIIATGRKVNKLNIENEQNLIGKGISYCALCDANFFKDNEVSIIGYDYKTVEEAIYLSKICSKVNFICEKSSLEAEQILLDKINSINNISIYYNSSISKLNEENGKLGSIDIVENNNPKNIVCSGLFISNGMSPQLDFENELEKSNGYIVVDKKMQTNILGIFACGDIISKDVYQLTTATSDATIAANSVQKYLVGR